MKYLILYSLICFCGIACNTPKTAALTSEGNVKDRPSPVIENSNSHGINPKPAASNQNNLTPSSKSIRQHRRQTKINKQTNQN